MRILRAFFREKWLEIAIVAICFQLITNAVSVLLGNRPEVIVLLALAILLLVAVVASGADMIRSHRALVGEALALDIPRRGVIFTVGLRSHEDDSTVLKVFRALRPEFCGFLGTNRTERERVVEGIVEKVGLGLDRYKMISVDPTNLRSIRDDIAHLIRWLQSKGLDERAMVVDLTGGTAIMSVAALMAADDLRVDSQYIASEFDANNKPIPGTQRALVVTSYRKA
ncbi:MAG: hypothetical protein HYY65_01080 [Candidatus Tectomicrobia bacterium]|uniref:TIGR02710 family CRISPR-associated protein n=1 Tax=Tectimicrobiota bacterium TaxID=2528274 RepID=A0A932GMJ7_UNCTE|nr:hypothetical protein [Candidatus Tectomicrobia bacterium]